jgi:hypothetical protein
MKIYFDEISLLLFLGFNLPDIVLIIVLSLYIEELHNGASLHSCHPVVMLPFAGHKIMLVALAQQLLSPMQPFSTKGSDSFCTTQV